MNRNLKRFVLLTALLLATFSISRAGLPTYADEYMDENTGYGLHGHFINNDDPVNLIDLVTTNEDQMVGGFTWFNSTENPGSFTMNQSVNGGKDAKFGFLTSNERWNLAIPAGNHLSVYKVDEELEELIQDQAIWDYPLDSVFWGHVNGDEYGDLVGTEDGSTHRVVVYVGYHWVDLQGNHHYDLNPNSNSDPFDPQCDTDQLALVRMHEFWDPIYWNRWDLLAVDAGNSNYIKLFHNDIYSSVYFTTNGMQTLDAVDPIRDFALGYLDDGGYPDLVLCTNDGQDHYVKTYLNTGSGSFSSNPNQSQSFDGIIDQVALGDYNHDWHSDIVVYWDGGRIDVYLNDGDGNLDFGSPQETCYTPDYGTDDVEANELMFVDLGGNNLYSVTMTGVKNGTHPGLWIWFNDGLSLYGFPVHNLTVDGGRGDHPTIKWSETEGWYVDKYVIYRALMPDTSRPTVNDLDSLSCVSRPAMEYTDTTVTIHTQNDNYKIWYTVTAMDDSGHESIKHDFVTFWGYYEESQGLESCGSVDYGQPAEFTLKVAPNPFNPTTAISYALPEAARVNLSIYDLNGRHVATLVDGKRDAGTHEVTFDGSHLASGVYPYRLQAADFSASGKMILMK